MKLDRLILFIFFSLIFSIGNAQKGKIRRATKDYDQFAYVRTSEALLQIANNGYKSVDLFQKLGNSFYFNNKMTEAAKWYGELMALNQEIDPEYYFRYAQALKYNEDYIESDKWMNRFYQSKTNDSRGKAFISNVDYLSKIEQINNTIDIYNLDINSEYSDFGTALYKDQIVFASSKGDGKIYKWNEQPYLDLYKAVKQQDSTYGKPSKFSDNINSEHHESTVAFTTDFKVMFFTRNNYYKKKIKKDNTGTSRLKMFRAIAQTDGNWGEIQPVHFNSDAYSVAHPTINSTNTKLYFASDMPGTSGQSDIFEADIHQDGSLGEPFNLGKIVNTEGQETFPFISTNGDLYFSSNGYPGLGGLDIYVIRDFENKRKSNQQLVVENVGKPINSPQDDFGYYENLEKKEGFFTSNRPQGKGDDDIYYFEQAKCYQIAEGLVKNKKTLELVPGSLVTLYNNSGESIDKQIVGNDAKFSFKVDCETGYKVIGSKEKFEEDSRSFVTDATFAKKLDLYLSMKPIEFIDDGVKIMINIKPIYFDFDKHNIRPDAAIELNEVVRIMKKYPKIIIESGSHTDSRGRDAYNEALSTRRANSTVQYIISKGIDPDRISGRGYGENQLTNDCSNGVRCTEEEHQLNRRTEFVVVNQEVIQNK